MNEPTAFSLFSGIGGLDLGLARAGFRHVAMCESDEWRRGILRARFPGVPVYDDVRVVGRDDGSPARGRDRHAARRHGGRGSHAALDLLCGGFPCQDLSVAGQRRGLAGTRSSLFFEYARIADALRPRWLLVENVPGLLSACGCAGCRRCSSLLRWHSRRGCPGTRRGAQVTLDGDEQEMDGGSCDGCKAARAIRARHDGTDFAVVRAALRELGYGVAYRIFDSRFFGVPQRRRRVFIVGALADGDSRAAAERAGQVLAVGTRCPGHPPQGVQTGEDVAPALSGRSASRLDDQGTGQLIAAPLSHGSNPNSNMAGRRREDDENLVASGFYATGGTHGLHGDRDTSPALKVGTDLGVGSANAVQAGDSVRRLTPRECERLQGLPDDWTTLGPDSRRYAALGDAVTATVAEWVGRRILAA